MATSMVARAPCSSKKTTAPGPQMEGAAAKQTAPASRVVLPDQSNVKR
jgi:hypothetical protein